MEIILIIPYIGVVFPFIGSLSLDCYCSWRRVSFISFMEEVGSRVNGERVD